jgi:hypothetical protein
MKNYRRYILLLTISLLCGHVALLAAALSPEQAKQVAARFLTARYEQSAMPGTPRRAPRQSEMQTAVVFSATDRAGQPYLYAVRPTTQSGYVLVSGDDRFAEVLAYSDHADFDEQTMPDNMRAWLRQYIDEMAYLESVGYRPSSPRASKQQAAISPLVQTQWNQSAPYNERCPYDPVTNNQCVTGCVATAMAQLINYHIQRYNAPTSIVFPIAAYTTKGRGIYMDATPVGTALPDKRLLLNTYKGTNATDAQKTAVALLMLYCGTAVEMNYTSSASSANATLVQRALIRNFGFDTTTRLLYRANYTYASWCDLIYSELAAERPVFYDGQSSGGAHAFVIDGYDGNSLFHVNWGWGGKDDGYFALSVLNPGDNSQIGASSTSDGYSGNQKAILGIRINTGPSGGNPLRMEATLLGVDNADHTLSYSAYNRTGEPHSFNYGTAFIGEGGEVLQLIESKTVTSLKNNSGYSCLTRTVPTNTAYANTTRKIAPVSREKGTDTWYAGLNTDLHYVLAEYDAEGVPRLTLHPARDLRVTAITVPTGGYVDDQQRVDVVVHNGGEEYYGTLYLFASLSDDKGEAIGQIGLTAMPDATSRLSFDWTATATGTYHLWICTDPNGLQVIGSADVLIREDPSTADRSLVITAFRFRGYDMASFRLDEATGLRTFDVYSDSLVGSVTLKNVTSSTMTDFRIRVRVEPLNEQTGQYERDNDRTYYALSFEPGQTRRLTINRGPFERGRTYRLSVVTRDNYVYLDDRYLVRLRAGDAPPTEEGLVPTPATPTPAGQKVLIDGTLYIISNGLRYNAQGMRIR